MQPDSADPDDDIDRKSLRALRDRFLALNQSRLEALRSRLPEERRTFLDAVPVLLHSNHAALPGFVDFEMPCGIERYAPDRRALNAVRKIALSLVSGTIRRASHPNSGVIRDAAIRRCCSNSAW